MKRIYLILTVLMLFIFTCGPAYAGLWDKFQGVALETIATSAIAGLFFILSLVFGKKALRFKKTAQEAKDCLLWYVRATDPQSEGGKKITNNELKAGLKEFGELGTTAASLLHKRTD